MFKRMTVVLLSTILLCSAVGSFAETFTMAGYDGETSSPHLWETNEFFIRMEKRTGTSFTFSEYTDSAEWNAAKQAMLKGENLPDVLFKANLTTQEAVSFDNQGILIDLLPLLPEYAPNLWILLQEHPEWLKAVTLPSGHVVALPAINELPSQNVMWMNQNWLDTLHLEAPATLDELHDVLTAFKERDPNRNGKKDEKPLTFTGPWDLKFLSHAYGVVTNDYNIYADEADMLHYWPLEDSFFALAQTLHTWYQEGLLDPDGFTTSDIMRRITEDDKTIPFGMFFAPTPMSYVTYSLSSQYKALLPLSFDGAQVYRETCSAITGGAFAITKQCSNPGELLRWVDVLYTEEGAIEAMVGYEDESWEWLDEEEEEEGKAGSMLRRWNWVGGENAMSSTMLNSITVYDTGYIPWHYPLRFGSGFYEATSIRLNEELMKFQSFVKAATKPVLPLGETRDRMMTIQKDLAAYVDVIFSQIVLGEEILTEEKVEEIRSEFRRLGCDELLQLYQSALY